MANFFLKLGTIDKKLLLPFIAAILYMLMDLIDFYSEMKELHIILDLYTRGISYTAIIIIPLIQKCLNKRKNENEQKFKYNKRTVLHFFLLYLGYFAYMVLFVYLTKLESEDRENTKDYKLSHYTGLCSDVGLQIIFIGIISKFLLKTKLYIHHYIGLILFIIFSLCIDIPFNTTLFKPRFYFILIFCIFLSTDSFFMTYEKYMMDKLYYSPFIIVFSIGILFLIEATFFSILIFINGNMIYNGKNYTLPKYSDYFDEYGITGPIIHIVYLISFRFPINILKILTIYYFSQFHTYSAYVLIKIFDLLLRNKSDYKFFSLPLFVFQILGLLVFLEIIELNFCGLNKNTKRNIESREKQEYLNLLRNDESSSEAGIDRGMRQFEITPGYFVCEMMNTSTEEGLKDYGRNSEN